MTLAIFSTRNNLHRRSNCESNKKNAKQIGGKADRLRRYLGTIPSAIISERSLGTAAQ